MSDGARYFSPPHAVTCWVDDRNVYVELPTKGQPYIQRFPITEAGFHKALSALKDIHDKIGRRYVLYTETDIKQAYRTKSKPKQTQFTDAQIQQAMEILKARGKI